MPGRLLSQCPQLGVLSPLVRLCGERAHRLPPPFPINQDPTRFFSPFHSCSVWRWRSPASPELSVSLWLGLPPYNGIKFKFKCGRDVKSTVRKENWRLQEHWGRLVVAFHNYRITSKAWTAPHHRVTQCIGGRSRSQPSFVPDATEKALR